MSLSWRAGHTVYLGVVHSNYLLPKASSGLHLLDSGTVGFTFSIHRKNIVHVHLVLDVNIWRLTFVLAPSVCLL